ncbi:MAG TPA: cupin domain-containing protein [Anaerolineales bacterium]|nr:cupin domain-containing protein [Anaerolineales bacterium]
MADKQLSKKTEKNSGRSNSPFAEPEHPEVSVGLRLREIRASRGLSMRALAELSGLNINTLSLIENERTSPSVSTLQQLAQSLQVPITEFFETNDGSKDLVHQKQGKRIRVSFEHGVMEDLAAGMPHLGAEPLIVTLNPGADSGQNPIVHTGREFVYCIEGHITYIVSGQRYLLDPGDSLVFEAYLPHQWENPDTTSSRILLVLCPMDIRDSPTERHFSKQVMK